METKFLLDSGDPDEYREIAGIAKQHQSVLWGSTTNPSLIAKKLAGRKVTFDQAFSELQRQIVDEIVQIVPGAVSAEVYSAQNTPAQDMVAQGKQIATWGPRVVVKLPTTLEGFKARTELRKLGICINNTLVFSQQQAFAITLHEKVMQQSFGKPNSEWPCFISPFVGRLDDIGENGLSMVEHSTKLIREFFPKDTAWMLEASVRTTSHLKKGIELDVELVTAPAAIYKEWFEKSLAEQNIVETNSGLKDIPAWQPPQNLLEINTIFEFMQALTDGSLDISHPLTTKGIDKFVADWSTIIS